MKDKYIDLMEKSLSAYSDDHILQSFNHVKKNGLTEHGFPRLTANIGILAAHGRRCDLLPIFRQMMEFCCKTIPHVKAANDFSVREIVCCLTEIEANRVVDAREIARWKSYLAAIEPTACYNKFAAAPTDDVRNWALFTAVSEYFRQCAGLCDSSDFIDLQIASQLQFMDENGMYMDNKGSGIHHPMLYDILSRGLFALLLQFGYRGRYYEEIDNCLKKAGLLTLDMQSSNGEIAFGGRSNQFIHNEGWLAAVFEYEANRYAKEGNAELAARFKRAVKRALAVTEQWLKKEPIRHIKNRFPTETKYGCERYAYFDKYMITTASNLYAAYLICDDSISTGQISDHMPTVFRTSEHFHKVFLKSGGYALEFDTNADPQYEAGGLGRVHREGAPAAICLSLSCPAEPHYVMNLQDPIALSLCPGICKNEEWRYAAGASAEYDVADLSKDKFSAYATVLCRFSGNECVTTKYTVNTDGVQIEVKGSGQIAYLLPAFYFDGEAYSEITLDGNCLNVSYEGWTCRYMTDGTLLDLGRLGGNRNGYYRAFAAAAQNKIRMKIEIIKSSPKLKPRT